MEKPMASVSTSEKNHPGAYRSQYVYAYRRGTFLYIQNPHQDCHAESESIALPNIKKNIGRRRSMHQLRLRVPQPTL